MSYQYLLEQSLKDITQKPKNIALTDKESQSAQLNQTFDQFKSHHLKPLITQFESQAEQFPNHIAIIYEDTALTCAELNEKANQLAHYLLSNNLYAEAIVAIYADKTPNLLIAMLAVWKTGAIYCLLDPDDPHNRTQTKLNEANPFCIITHSKQPLCTEQNCPIIELDDWEVFRPYNTNNPAIEVKLSNPACLNFLSHASNTPAGRLIDHQAMTTYIEAMGIAVQFPEHRSVLSLNSILSDLLIFDVFYPLTNHGQLIMPSESDLLDAKRFETLLNQHQVNIVQTAAQIWDCIITLNWPLRDDLIALCQHEHLSQKLAKKIIDKQFKLYSLFGYAETTSSCLIHQIDPNNLTIKLGKPLPLTQVAIHDNNQNFAPLGIPGQLLISGNQLTQPFDPHAVFATQHVDIQLNDTQSSTRFLTDDLVFFDEDNDILLYKKSDKSANSFGVKIYLKEIEKTLESHPHINQSVCVMMGEGNAQFMTCFYTANSEFNDDPAIINDFLAKKLPTLYLPHLFVKLQDIPHTQDGNIDINSLRQLIDRKQQTYFKQTNNEIEIKLSACFFDVFETRNMAFNATMKTLITNKFILLKLQKSIEKKFHIHFPASQIQPDSTFYTLAKQLNHLIGIKNHEVTINSTAIQKRVEKQKDILQQKVKHINYIL